PIFLIVSPAILDGDVFAFDEPSVIQALPKGIDNKCEAGSRGASEKSDHGIGCCARATSGQAAAAPTSSVMTSRRLMPDASRDQVLSWRAINSLTTSRASSV